MKDIDAIDLSLDAIRDGIAALRLDLERLQASCKRNGGPTVSEGFEIKLLRDGIKHGSECITAKRAYMSLQRRLMLTPLQLLENRLNQIFGGKA